MGPHNKLAATRQIIDDFEIQALVDHQLGWEEEKRVWSEIESNPQLRRRYNELVDMKKLLLQWWVGEDDAKGKAMSAAGKRETLLV
jgi:hypothetical protein